MQRSTSSVGFRSVALLVALGAVAPGCELATHFGDFQSGSDANGIDASADGSIDGGRDSATDANVDAPSVDMGTDAPLTDSGGATHHVTVTIAGTGSGALDAMGGALVCPSGTCTWTVDHGAAITIHGAASATSTLASWGGGCSGTTAPADCAITVDADVSLTATFDVRRVHLTVQVANPPGTVTSTTPALSCDGSTTPCSVTVDAGTSVTLTAAPGAPNTTVAWAGATCTGTTCMFTVSADLTITATFSDGRPVLSVMETGHGTVSTVDGRISCVNGAGDCSEVYDTGTSVTLNAVAETGYTFASWSGCDSSPTTTSCVIMLAAGAHPTVSATFTINHYTLTTSLGGLGTGTVTSSSPMVNCTSALGTCMTSGIAYGTPMTLTASPDSGNVFTGWAGIPGCGATSPCTFTMNGDATATANFAPDTRQITIALAGGDGQITSTAGEFNCTYTAGIATGTCVATLNVGATFDLNVSPVTGYHVMSWSSGTTPAIGCNSGTGTSTMCHGTAVPAIPGGGATITVTLAPTLYALSVTATATTGGGAIQSTATTTTTCTASGAGNTCMNSYPYGTMVTLHAAPVGGSTFLGWSGPAACAGLGDCIVTIDSAKSITGSFSLNTTQLAVSLTGSGSGGVTSITPPGAINCGATCMATLTVGSAVMLHATPGPNSVFAGWSGSGCSGTTDCSLTIVSGLNQVTASFTPVQEQLTVAPMGSGTGTVSETTLGRITNCTTVGTSACTAQYDYDAMIQLVASATGTATFGGWSTGCASVVGNVCTVRMDMPYTVRPIFLAGTGMISVTPTGTGGGLVTAADSSINCNLPGGGSDVCSASYTLPRTITLIASPSPHSHLTGWAGCDTVAGSQCTVVVTAGISLVTPTFDIDTYNVTTVITPAGLGSVRSSESTPSISCPGTCSHVYPYGATVTLSAMTTAPNLFSGWTGVAGCGASSICSFTVTGATTATANFVAPRMLTVQLPANTSAATSRILFASFAGGTCTTSASSATTCTASVVPGTYLLGSDAQPDYLGPIWSNGCTGPTCSVVVGAADVTISVTWAQLGNLAFVTSTTQNGAMGGYPGATSICMSRASAAGLPGSYLPWLSTSGSAMSARIPATDQVWVRPDGRPVATSRAQLFSGVLTHPMVVTESGTLAMGSAAVFTGTLSTGATAGQTCTDFSANSGSGMSGFATTSGSQFTQYIANPCATPQRIYCLQTGGSGFATLAPPPPPPDATYIWTSSSTGAGNISVATMDARCQLDAAAVGVSGTFVALVSTPTSSAFSRATRFGTLTRPDGWTVGPHNATNSVLWTTMTPNNWAVLPDDSLIGYQYIWTGMGANATGTGATCTSWTDGSSTMNGTVGDASSVVAGTWAGTSNQLCNNVFRWYCIQSGP